MVLCKDKKELDRIMQSGPVFFTIAEYDPEIVGIKAISVKT